MTKNGDRLPTMVALGTDFGQSVTEKLDFSHSRILSVYKSGEDIGYAAVLAVYLLEKRRYRFFSARGMANASSVPVFEHIVASWAYSEVVKAYTALVGTSRSFKQSTPSVFFAIVKHVSGRDIGYSETLDNEGRVTSFTLSERRDGKFIEFAQVQGISNLPEVSGEFTLEGSTLWWNSFGVDLAAKGWQGAVLLR